MQVLTINDDISLQLYNGPVGISFSGGADSSLLAYLAMTQLSVPIHLITTVYSEKEILHEGIARDVAKKLIEITGHTDVHHHFNRQPDAATVFRTSYDSAPGTTTLFDLCDKLLYQDGIVNSILTGVTANPPSVVLEDFNNSNAILRRRADVKRPLKVKSGWYNPQTNLNKQDICRLYDKHGILDTVFPLTLSCTETSTRVHCGTCWWCEEREWGLQFNS